jgi:hypothetical protein
MMAVAVHSGRQSTEGFSDVPKDHWAYEAVTDLKARGILIGYPPEPARTPAARAPRPAEPRHDAKPTRRRHR